MIDSLQFYLEYDDIGDGWQNVNLTLKMYPFETI